MGVTTPAPALQDYAIVIGVTYPSGTLSGLRGTLKDAAAFVEWLKSPRGGNVPKDNIRVVSSPPRAQSSARTARPIQEEIDEALEDVGVSLSRKPVGRRLYFYFTGHGFGGDPDDIGMLMAHATKKHLNRNIGLQGYREFFHNHHYFQQVVFILDCCRDLASPNSGAMPQLPTWTVDADIPRPVVDDLVIMAAPYGMKAHETIDRRTKKPRGLFTLALLDVLMGNLRIDAFNLKASLDTRMAALAAENGGVMFDQWASIARYESSRSVLVLNEAQEATAPVRIVAPKGLKGKLVVCEGTTNEIARRTAAKVTREDPPWLVDLSPARSYAVRHEKNASAIPLFAVIDWNRLEATKEDGNYVFIFPDA
jgi:hypothetical protein